MEKKLFIKTLDNLRTLYLQSRDRDVKLRDLFNISNNDLTLFEDSFHNIEQYIVEILANNSLIICQIIFVQLNIIVMKLDMEH